MSCAYIALRDDDHVHRLAHDLLNVLAMLLALREHLVAGPASAHDHQLVVVHAVFRQLEIRDRCSSSRISRLGRCIAHGASHNGR